MHDPAHNRSIYLRHHWYPYPTSSTPQNESLYFAGRIVEIVNSGKKRRLFLRGGQPEKIFHFDMKSCQWREDAQTDGPPPPATVLQINDLIQIEVLAQKANSFTPEVLLAHSVVLLAPHQGELLTNSCPQSLYMKWHTLRRGVENFFLAHGFVEIQTPTLVPSPGSEPFLDPFVVELQHEGQTHKKFLPTSPELHLKKALCLGWERIFEVRPCFRNGEWGNHHRPEFIMLEWYRAYENLDRILSDCQHLFSWVARSLGLPPPDPFENLTLQEAFLKYVDPNFLLTPHTCRKDLAALASRLCIETEPSDDFDDIFFRLFLEKIEPHLSGPIPIVLRNYPPSQAALSRKTVEGWADRFEIYWQGYEIANAFHELNDPFEQCQRLEKDNKKKNSLGKPIVPIDQEFIQGLMSGMPPSGGIALGLERLFLAFHPKLEIGQLRLFEFLNDSTIDHF